MNAGGPNGEHQILATSSLSRSGAQVLKHGDTFAVFERRGDVRAFGRLGAQGIYHEGTRYLSHFELKLGGARPLLLNSTVREDNVMLVVDLMSPDVFRAGQELVPHGTLHVLRRKLLWSGRCYEEIQLSNFGSDDVDIDLTVDFAADFSDVFEVRGTLRTKRGTVHETEVHPERVCLSYTGLDRRRRTTTLYFSPEPDQIDAEHVEFRVHLPPKETQRIYLSVCCDQPTSHQNPSLLFESSHRQACEAVQKREQSGCRLHSSNEQFNDLLYRSLSDLRMMITETEQGLYPYAGVPWFSVPFGRDGLITTLSSLWIEPDLGRGVLQFLAANQANEYDAERDAEPGKIVHEMRRGEMAELREIPFGRYYGSADSTPLFVMLAAEYYDVSGDEETIRRLWPNIERALRWIEVSGDADGDGFVEYGRRSKDGLVQQGWKDSHDSVFHADGTMAEGPIALCEIQGYVYAAQRGAARLSRVLGDDARAAELDRAADRLQQKFDEAFWCEDLQIYALALDGAKRPCRVRSSNAGHCLFSGIALAERARPVAEQMLSEEMFSDWGIRTLGRSERRYNPLSYHNGSVWPHDTAIVGAGLARYGFRDYASRILGGLFDASLFVDLHRLPELFCGFRRRPGDGPTLYPVACAPQAWAAAAPLLLLQSVLGMSIDGANRRVRFDYPTLPGFVREVTLTNLRIGPEHVSLHLRRHPEDVGINVLSRSSSAVQVFAVK